MNSAPETFYVDALTQLSRSSISFLVGGAFAFARYVGIERPTKDLDLFVKEEDVRDALRRLEARGYDVEMPFPHWLAKVRCCDGPFIDLIFNSGNGVARVDEGWFDHAMKQEILGVPVRLCPPEEMIWSKAFVQERERFDGADILHLIRQRGAQIDWHRLLTRFGIHWRVLLSHLVLFGFVYPDQRHRVPAWVLDELMTRLRTEASEADNRVCNGTLLSREQYLHDLTHFGYRDGRVEPAGTMTREETAIWTAAIEDAG
jgi:hypothetical protein